MVTCEGYGNHSKAPSCPVHRVPGPIQLPGFSSVGIFGSCHSDRGSRGRINGGGDDGYYETLMVGKDWE